MDTGIGTATPPAGGADAGGAAPPPDGPRITRVNSPGPGSAPGVASTGLTTGACRGSRLSVKGPEAAAGNAGGGGVGAGGGVGLAPDGVPPPKMRVNSPGVREEDGAVGIALIGDSAGVARGLRNSRVNSPGCLSEARAPGIAEAGVGMGAGSLGWLRPPRPKSWVNSPGPGASAGGGGGGSAGAEAGRGGVGCETGAGDPACRSLNSRVNSPGSRSAGWGTGGGAGRDAGAGVGLATNSQCSHSRSARHSGWSRVTRKCDP